jgi:hypothetical protein
MSIVTTTPPARDPEAPDDGRRQEIGGVQPQPSSVGDSKSPRSASSFGRVLAMVRRVARFIHAALTDPFPR